MHDQPGADGDDDVADAEHVGERQRLRPGEHVTEEQQPRVGDRQRVGEARTDVAPGLLIGPPRRRHDPTVGEDREQVEPGTHGGDVHAGQVPVGPDEDRRASVGRDVQQLVQLGRPVRQHRDDQDLDRERQPDRPGGAQVSHPVAWCCERPERPAEQRHDGHHHGERQDDQHTGDIGRRVTLRKPDRLISSRRVTICHPGGRLFPAPRAADTDQEFSGEGPRMRTRTARFTSLLITLAGLVATVGASNKWW
ncbi:MAG TPA: hypothetical protein VHE83_05125 [Mycobacteriales bacterium]|nr:hypothetical protein [Mycobacteriales bacterium]